MSQPLTKWPLDFSRNNNTGPECYSTTARYRFKVIAPDRAVRTKQTKPHFTARRSLLLISAVFCLVNQDKTSARLLGRRQRFSGCVRDLVAGRLTTGRNRNILPRRRILLTRLHYTGRRLRSLRHVQKPPSRRRSK